MSPKRRQDRNAFLIFLAVVPIGLLVAPLPFLRVASENYAVNQRIAKMQKPAPAAAVGGGTAPAPAAKEAVGR
jgi:hypothetical protein